LNFEIVHIGARDVILYGENRILSEEKGNVDTLLLATRLYRIVIDFVPSLVVCVCGWDVNSNIR